MTIGYIVRALFGRRMFSVEVTLPDDRKLIVRGLPERHLDSYLDAAATKGRSVRIINIY